MDVTNRFKGLDLLDRVPEELWTEVCNILQEAVTKTITKQKKCKKAKWPLLLAVCRRPYKIANQNREVKSKGERESYIQQSADFQSTAQRDKKACFNEQCITLEETTKGKRLEMSSGKLEISREHFAQRWAQ